MFLGRKYDKTRAQEDCRLHNQSSGDEIMTEKTQFANSQEALQSVEQFGLPIRKIHGQRKLGPPKDWSGPPPDRSLCEVFVGKVPRHLNESDIYPVFRRIGVIYELRLMMDFSGSNRGFCFVMYANAVNAKTAIDVLNNYEISKKRRICVLASVNNRRLCATQLPRDLDSAAFTKVIR